MKRRPGTNYINNKDLYEHMVRFIDNRNDVIDRNKSKSDLFHEPMPEIPRYIGEAIMLITDRLGSKGNFSGYSFLEEMKGDAIENCVMYLHNFNPNKSKNPFAYITLIIWNAFVRRIEKEAKHSYIRHKMMFNSSVFTDISDVSTEDALALGGAMESMSNDKSIDVISKFEQKLVRKKERLEEKKRLKEEDIK